MDLNTVDIKGGSLRVHGIPLFRRISNHFQHKLSSKSMYKQYGSVCTEIPEEISDVLRTVFRPVP